MVVYFCVNVEGYYPWVRMLSSPLHSVICVRLWERQDLLLADNFTRQMESGIGSFQILFIDNWAKTNPIISSSITVELIKIKLYLFLFEMNPVILPCFLSPLRHCSCRVAVECAFNICIILPWVNMKLRFILSALKAGSSSHPLHFISPTSIPLHADS